MLGGEPIGHLAHGAGGVVAAGDAGAGKDAGVGSGADGADDFGAAGFDGAEEGWGVVKVGGG